MTLSFFFGRHEKNHCHSLLVVMKENQGAFTRFDFIERLHKTLNTHGSKLNLQTSLCHSLNLGLNDVCHSDHMTTLRPNDRVCQDLNPGLERCHLRALPLHRRDTTKWPEVIVDIKLMTLFGF